MLTHVLAIHLQAFLKDDRTKNIVHLSWLDKYHYMYNYLLYKNNKNSKV